MNVVLDTNIFISGIFWKGDSYKILCLWDEGRIQLIISQEIISEIFRVLSDFKVRLSEELQDAWITRIREYGVVVDPKERFHIVSDPADDKFIDVAIAGNASYIISNDKHLLTLKQFKGVRILTPKEFLKIRS
ncbi:MAG: putative toxin-antitoxin system toxin component, PIN family [Candidatus Woesearchaeota archaeon]